MNVKCAHRKRTAWWGGCEGGGIPPLFTRGERGREEGWLPRKVQILETKEEGGGSGVRSGIKITQTCSP